MAKDSTNLRDLKLNPKHNPFLKTTNPVPTKNGLVATKMSTDLVDPRTGEQHSHALIHKIKEVDDQHFVKVFAEGVKKAFELNRTEARIFQKILDVYGAEKMTGGYADSITLCWFDDGLNGEKINMSEKTFKRGMVGLLKKEFILPKTRDQFWVNPSLFFKGDRVAFVTEYRRTQKTKQDKLEDAGQQRLID
jgi:hypothetical protein